MTPLVHIEGRSPYPLVLPSLDQLDAAIEALIELRDALTGDVDAENGNDAEDDFVFTPLALAYAAEQGPGCPIADPDKGAEEDGEREEGV